MDSIIAPKRHTSYYIYTLIATAAFGGFTIALTFAPCYNGMCVERYFPKEARIHIATYYALIVLIAVVLAIRASFRPIRRLSNTHVFNAVVPILGKRLSIGGLLLITSIAAVTFGSIGFWYPAEYDYWNARGALVDWTTDTYRVVWTGITGHWCDIWIGLLILPVSRNSILGRGFYLHQSTILTAHKLLAYALFAGVLVHGVTYFTFVAAYAKAGRFAVYSEFSVDNPLITFADASGSAKTPLSSFLLPSGVVSLVLILIILIFSLPVLRRRSYNTFYFVHIISAIAILVVTCLHASTNFYFLLPGIVLWVGDWVWRIFHALGRQREATIENAGDGWYRVRLPQGHVAAAKDLEEGEKVAAKAAGCSPLATYYINIPAVSRLQIHPFTAAVTDLGETGPVLLFQKVRERKKSKKSDKQWTRKLGAMVDVACEKQATVQVRIEGPYITVVPEMYTADHILLIVGGTGITGALSIANWWAGIHGSTESTAKTLRLIWTIRVPNTALVHEVQELKALMAATSNMHFGVHVSSHASHLDPERQLNDFLRDDTRNGRAWIYASGPEGLLASVEAACVKLGTRPDRTKGEVGSTAVTELDWYMARWSR